MYSVKQVFSNAAEKLLNDYIILYSNMHHGLTLRQLKLLAYQYARNFELHSLIMQKILFELRKCFDKITNDTR